MSVIEFILWGKFGSDIGQVIISFLDSNWSKKEYVTQKQVLLKDKERRGYSDALLAESDNFDIKVMKLFED